MSRPVPQTHDELLKERDAVDDLLNYAIDVADTVKGSKQETSGMLAMLDGQLRQIVVELRYLNDRHERTQRHDADSIS